MKRLSKEQDRRRDEVAGALRDAAEKVEAATAKANEAIGELRSAVEAYNEALASAGEYRDEITSDMQAYQDERSEKWQEGEAGQNYAEWQQEWEGYDTSELELPDDIDPPEMPHADELDGLRGDPS